MVVKRSLAAVSAVALMCGMFSSAARALPPAEKDWEAQIKLYSWLTWIQTKVEAGGAETTLDLDLGDVLSDLGWAAMGGIEGRYKRGLVLVDFFGSQLAEGGSSNARTFPFQLPGPLGRPAADARPRQGGHSTHDLVRRHQVRISRAVAPDRASSPGRKRLRKTSAAWISICSPAFASGTSRARSTSATHRRR